MSSVRSLLSLTIASALFALPALAAADDSKPPAPTAVAKKPHVRKVGKVENKDRHYPMKSAEFQKVVEDHIAKARVHLDKALDAHSVPNALREQIKKDFEAGAATVRAAAKDAGSDGQITHDEAKKVHGIARDLKEKAREKYGLANEHHKKGKKAETNG